MTNLEELPPIHWVECVSLECNPSYNSVIFWESVNVWVHKPHILNKRIGAVCVFEIGQHSIEFLYKLCCALKQKPTDCQISSVNDLLEFVKKSCSLEDNYSVKRTSHTSIRIFYPKSGEFKLENVEFIIKDVEQNIITFIKLFQSIGSGFPSPVPYAIHFENAFLMLLLPSGTAHDHNVFWLSSTLFPKLIKWMRPTLAKQSVCSNQLVPADKYVKMYDELKKKYYAKISEIWTESTNPQKFIIEDIAIASYLLLLWGGSPQRFVDLGCGNGLLVYILNSEQNLGIGLDVRARKIWKNYPALTVLQEKTVSPSLDCVFPDVDWIIGNHSDELTPWIPVMAARSSYKTNFFLLPCCLFEFNGSKYARSCSSKTCYEEYMEYVENISDLCGFKTEKDRLKIPSTKRICFVGRERMYSENKKSENDKIIEDFVNQKLNYSDIVKLRESKEKVRNCTQLNKDFLSSVVRDIASYIIQSSTAENTWREGKFIPLNEIINILSLERRQQLKNECGGLQTLLKNHHYIFHVCEGKVKLRKPSPNVLSSNFAKKKNCWFFSQHPDSCPLSEEECSYLHV